jgi:GGDEF domain-containing protein
MWGVGMAGTGISDDCLSAVAEAVRVNARQQEEKKRLERLEFIISIARARDYHDHV